MKHTKRSAVVKCKLECVKVLFSIVMLPAGGSSVRWLEEMHAANQYSVMVGSEVLKGIDLLMLPRAQRSYDIESYWCQSSLSQ